MITNRILITSQGITQFLAGYIACNWHNRSNNITIDVLVYDTFAPSEVDLKIYQIIKKISHILEINNVYFISHQDTVNMVGLPFAERLYIIKNRFHEFNYDQVYMSRDLYGNGNIYILNLFKFAKIIGYGDSFGLIGYSEMYNFEDLIKKIIINPIRYIIKILLYKFPINNANIVNYVLTIPIIYKTNNYNIQIVKSDFSIKLMGNIANKITNNKFNDSEFDIYLLTNFSGCGWSSELNEIQLYEEIIRTNSKSQANIVIKKHPRSSNLIINLLIDRLKIDYNINQNEVLDLDMPLEISGIHMLNNARIFSIFSTCSYSLKFFFQKNVYFPLTNDLVNKYCNPKFKKIVIKENKNDQIVYKNILKFIENNENTELLFKN